MVAIVVQTVTDLGRTGKHILVVVVAVTGTFGKPIGVVIYFLVNARQARPVRVVAVVVEPVADLRGARVDRSRTVVAVTATLSETIVIVIGFGRARQARPVRVVAVVVEPVADLRGARIDRSIAIIAIRRNAEVVAVSIRAVRRAVGVAVVTVIIRDDIADRLPAGRLRDRRVAVTIAVVVQVPDVYRSRIYSEWWCRRRQIAPLDRFGYMIRRLP